MKIECSLCCISCCVLYERVWWYHPYPSISIHPSIYCWRKTQNIKQQQQHKTHNTLFFHFRVYIPHIIPLFCWNLDWDGIGGSSVAVAAAAAYVACAACVHFITLLVLQLSLQSAVSWLENPDCSRAHSEPPLFHSLSLSLCHSSYSLSVRVFIHTFSVRFVKASAFFGPTSSFLLPCAAHLCPCSGVLISQCRQTGDV